VSEMDRWQSRVPVAGHPFAAGKGGME
jgi:hypothetical protein